MNKRQAEVFEDIKFMLNSLIREIDTGLNNDMPIIENTQVFSDVDSLAQLIS